MPYKIRTQARRFHAGNDGVAYCKTSEALAERLIGVKLRKIGPKLLRDTVGTTTVTIFPAEVAPAVPSKGAGAPDEEYQ
jgi:hypothetical protein